MAITGLPTDTDADIARVTEALAMITPRWNVRILLALSGPPPRYTELASRMPWLRPSQLHPKLQSLCDSGLVERTEHTVHHVTYGRTHRSEALLPVLSLIVAWAEENLEKTDRPLPAIEQIEDTLTLLTRRHAAALLWALKTREEISGRGLAAIVMPSSGWTNVYPPLRQLVDDGLVDTGGKGQPYRLSTAGQGLGPVFSALSAWAAGRPLSHASEHPVWGNPSAAPTQWASRPLRIPASTRAPVLPSGGGIPWPNQLFSHAGTARTQSELALPVAVGPRR